MVLKNSKVILISINLLLKDKRRVKLQNELSCIHRIYSEVSGHRTNNDYSIIS